MVLGVLVLHQVGDAGPRLLVVAEIERQGGFVQYGIGLVGHGGEIPGNSHPTINPGP